MKASTNIAFVLLIDRLLDAGALELHHIQDLCDDIRAAAEEMADPSPQATPAELHHLADQVGSRMVSRWPEKRF